MPTKKLRLIPLLLLLLVMLTACRRPQTYPLLAPQEEIVGISLVAISFDQRGAVVETELCPIDDVTAFMADFRALDCFTWYGDPLGVTEEGKNATAVKMMYHSGAYELIGWAGQSRYHPENGFNYYAGYCVFDEASFTAFINAYL